jgi:hypothetical protein
MKPKPWFWPFINRHIDRLRRPDWPEAGARFWDAMWAGLDQLRATEAEADEASVAVAIRPSRWLDEQIPSLLDKIREQRAVLSERYRAACPAIPRRDHFAERAAWEALPEAERRARVDSMLARTPWLRGWTPFLVSLCIDELAGHYQPLPSFAVPAASAAFASAAKPVRRSAERTHAAPEWLKTLCAQVGATRNIAMGPDGKLHPIGPDGRLVVAESNGHSLSEDGPAF